MKTIALGNLKKYCSITAVFFLSLLIADEIDAQGIRNQNARMDVRGTSRRTARRVNRRHDAYYGGAGYGGGYAAPVATAAVATAATAAVLYSLPSGCSLRPYSGVNYHYCNGAYYQEQYEGTTVVYVEVEVEGD